MGEANEEEVKEVVEATEKLQRFLFLILPVLSCKRICHLSLLENVSCSLFSSLGKFLVVDASEFFSKK